MNESKPNYTIDSISILTFLFKWKKPVLIITGLAAILSFIFSGPTFIKPKYKASVIFYPASTNSISKTLTPDPNSQDDPLRFGEETQSEQMMQLLYSDEIRTRIAQKFDLINHYHIDSTSKKATANLISEYNENVKFKRTEFMSVEIEVSDTDPRIAADIANEIAVLVDTVKNNIQMQQAGKLLDVSKRAYLDKISNIKKLTDSVSYIRSLGVHDYYIQVDNIFRAITLYSTTHDNEKAKLKVYEEFKSVTPDTTIVNAKARISGSSATLKILHQELEILRKWGSTSVLLKDIINQENTELGHLKARYDRALFDTKEMISFKFIVNNARVPEKKSYPIRWLIMLIATFGTFILTIISLITLENYRQIIAARENEASTGL